MKNMRLYYVIEIEQHNTYLNHEYYVKCARKETFVKQNEMKM